MTQVILYCKFIDSMLLSGVDISKITNESEFRSFRINNPIFIKDAQMLDFIYFGYSGTFWLAAYDYPSENDKLDNSYTAKNVGLFTFNKCRVF